MKVKDCKNCEYCRRKVWSTSYKPLNYHTIGVSHAYAYCDLKKARVLNVKKCGRKSLDPTQKL